jgi:hypothetical protein
VSAPADRYVDLAFLGEDGNPRLARCALLFLDLLGVTEMASSPRAQQNLLDLERAIRGPLRDLLDPESPWPAAMFSDTLVMTAPTDLFGGDESALAGLLMHVSRLQLNLAERGFFARGSITLGDFYIRDELVFGEALVEAYGLERDEAIHPRVIVSNEVLEVQRQKPKVFVATTGATATLLLRDRDGRAFVNYLEMLVGEAGDETAVRVAAHRDALASKLNAHRDNSRVWEKYRWVSEYHNHFCNEHEDEDWFAPDLMIPDADLAQELRSLI